MKKLLIILTLFLSISNLFGEIAVKSFRKLENDLDARVTSPLKDQNGDVCAIIKVVTTQTGFTFDGGQLGIVKTVQKSSEIWVYVPYGLKRLSIFHPQLGQLRDYIIPITVEKACVYEMTLISGRIETIVIEEIESQFILIKSNPANALIFIDDQFVKSGGEYQSKIKLGKHTYRVEAPLYHTDAGIFEISDSKKVLNINLKPAFGYLNISSSPEQGASILLDGKPIIQTTPFKTDALASGEHTVQTVKDMYTPVTQKITVIDGQTIPVIFNLIPNFAELSITASDKTTIYINNTAKGTGSWHGRLEGGIYSLEARLDRYRPARQDIELVAGDNKTVELQPTPIYGSLDVMSTPSEASITINGKDYGTTPTSIKRLLIGDYTVQLSKPDYANLSRAVTITDGKTTEINENLTEQNQINKKRLKNGFPEWFFRCPAPTPTEIYSIGISDPELNNLELARQQATMRAYTLASLSFESNYKSVSDKNVTANETMIESISRITNKEIKLIATPIDSFSTSYDEKIYLFKFQQSENGKITKSLTDNYRKDKNNRSFKKFESGSQIENNQIHLVIKDSIGIPSVKSTVNNYSQDAEFKKYYYPNESSTCIYQYGLWYKLFPSLIKNIENTTELLNSKIKDITNKQASNSKTDLTTTDKNDLTKYENISREVINQSISFSIVSVSLNENEVSIKIKLDTEKMLKRLIDSCVESKYDISEEYKGSYNKLLNDINNDQNK